MKQSNLVLAAVIAAIVIWLPQSVAAQTQIVKNGSDGLERTYMFFELSETEQFAPGRAVITKGIYSALDSEKDRIQEMTERADLVTVVGTQDSLRFRCGANIPQTESPEFEQMETCDADLSEERADVISGEISRILFGETVQMLKMSHYGLTVPNSIQTKKMSRLQRLVNQRGFFLIFDNYQADGLSQSELDDRLAQLKDDLEGQLAEIAKQAERAEAKADRALAQNTRQDGEIDDLWTFAKENRDRIGESGGSNVDGIIGAGVRQFDDILTPTLYGGIKINGGGNLDNFSIRGWAGFKKSAKTITLDRNDFSGDYDLRRLQYGLQAAWYPLDTEYISAGPSAGWSHSEDLIAGTSKRVRKVDALDLGLDIDIAPTSWLHINLYGGYTPYAKMANETDYEVSDAAKDFSFAAGVSLNF